MGDNTSNINIRQLGAGSQGAAVVTNFFRRRGTAAVGADQPRSPESGWSHAVVDCPFLSALLFALQSDRLPLTRLASTLAETARGHWNTDMRIFTVDRSRRRGSDVQWELTGKPWYSLVSTSGSSPISFAGGISSSKLVNLLDLEFSLSARSLLNWRDGADRAQG